MLALVALAGGAISAGAAVKCIFCNGTGWKGNYTCNVCKGTGKQ